MSDKALARPIRRYLRDEVESWQARMYLRSFDWFEPDFYDIGSRAYRVIDQVVVVGVKDFDGVFHPLERRPL